MSISLELREKLVSCGASVVGYADLKHVSTEKRIGYNYGVAIGVALNPEIILGITDGPTIRYYEEFKRVNNLLNELDEYAAIILKDKGFSAYPKVQKNIEIDKKTWRTELPHKTVATRAGIGWIGKCALLVTKEFGSAIRISSVLTDAELETGTPIEESKCGECLECKSICPAGAVLGNNWHVSKDRDEFYDSHACRKTTRERSSKIGLNESLCGLCILSCPWTKRYLRG